MRLYCEMSDVNMPLASAAAADYLYRRDSGPLYDVVEVRRRSSDDAEISLVVVATSRRVEPHLDSRRLIAD